MLSETVFFHEAYADIAAGMCVPLVVFLSSVVLRSVSAGGVYCAKTARARAAALGLDYPGVHGAPDLLGPAHHGMHTDTMPFSPQSYNSNDLELAETESRLITSSRQNQPGMRSLDDRRRKQAHPRVSESTFLLHHGPYNPVQSEYTTHRVLRLPRGQSVINRKSNFEEVKHVAPPTLTEAAGQSDLVNWNPQGRNKPLSFVHNEHDLVVDESVPNRRGVSLSGLPLPQSKGHGIYQRGLSGYGLGNGVPVLGSSGFTSKDSVGAMTGRGPTVRRLRRIRLPGSLPQPLHRSMNVKQFVQGNPVLRHMTKPNQVQLE
uniref:uncharacterized protein LOC124065413 n=1 Tax=Scatophagus argus TaxID=75038 RepID=UPI001ED805EA|nr:uncharacterized protein LOC124065413 [Scatophagus argus]